MKKEIQDMVDNLKEEMDLVVKDRDVPRNVKEKIKNAKKELENEEEEEDMRIARAIYLLNDVSEDINIPFHARTDIMSLTSQLEEINELLKEDEDG